MDWTAIGQHVIFGLSNGMAYALFAVGLSLVWGIVGIINLAHGELYMLGGLLAWWLVVELGLNYLVGIIAAILMVAVAGMVNYQIAARPLLGTPKALLATFLATLGLSMIITNSIVIATGRFARRLVTPYDDTLISAGDLHITGPRIMIFVIGVVAMVLLHLFITRTRWGKMMAATAESSVGALLVGIDPGRMHLFAFALAGALAALGGILLAPIWYTHAFAGQSMLLIGFVVVIVAGLGSILGAIAIGLLVGLSESLFTYFVSMHYASAFTFAMMIMVLLLKPNGLFRQGGASNIAE